MTLHYEDDDAIERLARRMIGCALPKTEWTHAAHFATALWLIRHEDGEPAEARMPGLIRRYNESVGGVNSDTEGYHETITQASLAAARAVLAAHPPEAPLHVVLDALMAGELGKSGWPLAYWSKDRLFSAEARRAWVEPDLFPFNPRPPA